YATAPAGGCDANFTSSGNGKIGQKTGDPLLDKLHAKLAAALGDGSNAQGKHPKPLKQKRPSKPDPFKTLRELTNPRNVAQRHPATHHGASQGQQPGQGRYHRTPEDQALDYLLGGGG